MLYLGQFISNVPYKKTLNTKISLERSTQHNWRNLQLVEGGLLIIVEVEEHKESKLTNWQQENNQFFVCDCVRRLQFAMLATKFIAFLFLLIARLLVSLDFFFLLKLYNKKIYITGSKYTWWRETTRSWKYLMTESVSLNSGPFIHPRRPKKTQ